MKRAVGGVVAAMVLGLAAVPVLGGPIVYEGYNGYSGSLAQTATNPNVNPFPNSNTVGLDTSARYFSNANGAYTFNATGLTFSTLPTNGGSLTVAAGSSAVIAAHLDLAPVTGNLYQSYLVQFGSGSPSSTSGSGAQSRVANDTSTTSTRFYAEADSRSGGTSTTGAVGYSSTVNFGTVTLSNGPVYLVIAKFTNVGTALSSSNTGVATQWVLTAAQYDGFIAAGATEGYLNTAGTVTERIVSSPAIQTGTFNFDSNSYIQFATVNDAVTYDEVRYGTTLADVVPEPAGLTVAGLAGMLLIRRHRRPVRASAGA